MFMKSQTHTVTASHILKPIYIPRAQKLASIGCDDGHSDSDGDSINLPRVIKTTTHWSDRVTETATHLDS